MYRTTIALLAVTLVACGSNGDTTGDGAGDAMTTVADTTTTSPPPAPTPPPTTDAPTEPTLEPATTTTPTDRSTTPTEDTVPDDPIDDDEFAALPAPVRFAVTDLRERVADPSAEVTVVSVDEVEWPDGSIGCPEPGLSYTQAIVNGSRIVLMTGGIQYEYHQAAGGDPFYCPPGRSTYRAG